MERAEIRETVRGMLADWDAATEEQRQAALEAAEIAAGLGVCVFCDSPITLAADGAWEDSSGACGCGDGEHEPRAAGSWTTRAIDAMQQASREG